MRNRQARASDFLDHDARYERTAEFLQVVRGAWRGPGFNHAGEHYRIEEGGIAQPLTAAPTIYFGGSSSAAEAVAAAHADVYLTWAETPTAVRERVASVRQRAAAHGRTVRFGIRLHVITRDSGAGARDLSESLGRRRTRPGWGWHFSDRQPRPSCGPHRRVRVDRGRHLHPLGVSQPRRGRARG